MLVHSLKKCSSIHSRNADHIHSLNKWNAHTFRNVTYHLIDTGSSSSLSGICGGGGLFRGEQRWRCVRRRRGGRGGGGRGGAKRSRRCKRTHVTADVTANRLTHVTFTVASCVKGEVSINECGFYQGRAGVYGWIWNYTTYPGRGRRTDGYIRFPASLTYNSTRWLTVKFLIGYFRSLGRLDDTIFLSWAFWNVATSCPIESLWRNKRNKRIKR